MANRRNPDLSAGNGETALPAQFITISGFAFIAGVAATAYFCRSMAGGMEMPGSWTMSMMWMPMPGQSRAFSAAMFLLMWLAMMVAMMMPSALPTFLKTRRAWASLCFMASGYFAVWLAAGAGIYVFGTALATLAMQSASFSRAVPWLGGASLIVAGAFQCTPWKMKHLSRCRSSFGCAASCPVNEPSFRLGCKQGTACCVCCWAPMAMLLALGMMNPSVIIIVALIIAAEKLLPQHAIVAQIVGISAIFAGVATFGDVILRSM
jgi:predicted metal-binding membrane protein